MEKWQYEKRELEFLKNAIRIIAKIILPYFAYLAL